MNKIWKCDNDIWSVTNTNRLDSFSYFYLKTGYFENKTSQNTDTHPHKCTENYILYKIRKHFMSYRQQRTELFIERNTQTKKNKRETNKQTKTFYRTSTFSIIENGFFFLYGRINVLWLMRNILSSMADLYFSVFIWLIWWFWFVVLFLCLKI